MYIELFKLKQEMDLSKYTLKDLALYFKQYNNYIIIIKTDYRTIKFKLSITAFTHLIGLQHVYANSKEKNQYKGISGYEKIINNEVTYSDIMKYVKSNQSIISWQKIKDRIQYLPMFLNTIMDKKTMIKIRDNSLLYRQTKLKGKYFVYKNLHNNKYPMLFIKDISNNRHALETFMVENDITLLGTLKSEKIINIEIIKPIVTKKAQNILT